MVIPPWNIVAPEQMRKRGELLGPSQFFQHTAQADDSSDHGVLGQRWSAGPQLSQPTEEVRIAPQLLQRADLRMVSSQVSQKQVDGALVRVNR